MPKATRTPTTPAAISADGDAPPPAGAAAARTTRRGLLGGTVGTLGTSLAVTAAILSPDPVWSEAATPDAHLLSLCAAYHAALAHRIARSAAWDADEATGYVRATEAAWQDAWEADHDAEHAAAQAVLPVRPQTLAGLAAKAAVAQAVTATMRLAERRRDFDEMCADQVLADMLALAGRA